MYRQYGECVINYLDFSNEFVVLFILCVWEFIDFYFVLLYFFHYLSKKESNHNDTSPSILLTSNMEKYLGISLLKVALKSIYSKTMLYIHTNTCFLNSWHSSGVRVSAFAMRGMTLTLSWSLFMNSMSRGFRLSRANRNKLGALIFDILGVLHDVKPQPL